MLFRGRSAHSIWLTGLMLAAVLSAVAEANGRTNITADVGRASMELWVGHWISRGDPGSWHADTVCKWSREADYVICDQIINEHTKQLLVISYDNRAKEYRMTSLGQARPPVIQTATVKDLVWTITGTYKQDGKTMFIRGTTDFSESGVYRDKQEHSEDGGVHWIVDSRGKGVKQHG